MNINPSLQPETKVEDISCSTGPTDSLFRAVENLQISPWTRVPSFECPLMNNSVSGLTERTITTTIIPESMPQTWKDIWPTIILFCNYKVQLALRAVAKHLQHTIDISFNLPRIYLISLQEPENVHNDYRFRVDETRLQFARNSNWLIRSERLLNIDLIKILEQIIEDTRNITFLDRIEVINYDMIMSEVIQFATQNSLDNLARISRFLSGLKTIDFAGVFKFTPLQIPEVLLSKLSSLTCGNERTGIPVPQWFLDAQEKIASTKK